MFLCLPLFMLFVLPELGQADEFGTHRVLIVAGHPGNEEIRKEMTESIDRFVIGLPQHWGVNTENLRVLFGAPEMESDGGLVPQKVDGAATLENLQLEVAQIQKDLAANDALWVILLGHSFYDGRQAWFNLSGEDPDAIMLGEVFAPLNCLEIVFWLAMSASGEFVQPLSGPGRIVVSATDNSPEIDAPRFAASFSAIVAEPLTLQDFDLDRDGQASLLDLYVATCSRVVQSYLRNRLVLIEHALLDDNGDGRGRGVQQYYLSEELGGRVREGRPLPIRSGMVDGVASSKILLRVTLPQPVETQAEAASESSEEKPTEPPTPVPDETSSVEQGPDEASGAAASDAAQDSVSESTSAATQGVEADTPSASVE